MGNEKKSCAQRAITDKGGFSYIMWCILIVCLVIIMAFILSYVIAIGVTTSQKNVAEQVLDGYINQNSIRIHDNIKQGEDYTEAIMTEEYVEKLIRDTALTTISPGQYASVIDAQNYRYTISNLKIEFVKDKSANILLTYTLRVPLEFNGQNAIWVTIPMKITSQLDAHFDTEQ